MVDNGLSLDQLHQISKTKTDIVKYVQRWRELGLPKLAIGPQMDDKVHEFERQRAQRATRPTPHRRSSPPTNGAGNQLEALDDEETQWAGENLDEDTTSESGGGSSIDVLDVLGAN